jgi:hypothetical protein
VFIGKLRALNQVVDKNVQREETLQETNKGCIKAGRID